MRSDGVRIIKATTAFSNTSIGYDSSHSYMYGYTLDLNRKTAVLMRQSKRGADEDNPESRLRQEGLVRVAVEIRADHDPLMVIECDEGSGVSGQKKIYERPKMLELWEGIQNGTVGSVIVAREDRLFRDRHLTQATQFAEACYTHNVILIVAGRRCYNFHIHDNFNSFIDKMREAYGYIDTHVRYMQQMMHQKLSRGEWIGGGLVAPYVLDRMAIIAARDQRKIIKEFGGGADDELLITKAYRPVIFEPWHPIAVDLFEKFRMFDYSRSRIGRYVDERKYLFPLPKMEDIQRYLFHIRMGMVPGLGYGFSDGSRLSGWFCNLMHMGYISAGKDEEGNRVYIENAFDAAISRDLFEPAYEAVTGFTLDGKQSTRTPNRSRFVRGGDERTNALAPHVLFRSTDKRITFRADYDAPGITYYAAYLTRSNHDGKGAGYLDSNRLWSIPSGPFDAAIVERLTDLAKNDNELADRVEQYYKELTQKKVTEKASILEDITRLEALVAHYDRVIHKPARPLSEAQEAHYIGLQADAMEDLEKAKGALVRYERAQPGEFIPAFYHILGKAPGEFWNLDVDKQRHMLSMLIDEIQVTNIAPHIYKLLMKWKDPVAQHWDNALIFKRQAVRTKLAGVAEWTDEEDELLRELWPAAAKLDMYKAFPLKTGNYIKARAVILGLRRNQRMPEKISPIQYSLCYEDWLQSCAALDTEPESEEGQKVLKVLNYYARTTENRGEGKEGALAAFWWILPVVEMSGLEERLAYLTRPETAHYLIETTRELAKLLGINMEEMQNEHKKDK